MYTYYALTLYYNIYTCFVNHLSYLVNNGRWNTSEVWKMIQCYCMSVITNIIHRVQITYSFCTCIVCDLEKSFSLLMCYTFILPILDSQLHKLTLVTLFIKYCIARISVSSSYIVSNKVLQCGLDWRVWLHETGYIAAQSSPLIDEHTIGKQK